MEKNFGSGLRGVAFDEFTALRQRASSVNELGVTPGVRRMTMRKLKPVTPGELLLEEFLRPIGISQYRLAKEISVPAQRIGEIVAGALLLLTPTYVCAGFSVSPTATGCVPR